jgi:hypothetical protein
MTPTAVGKFLRNIRDRDLIEKSYAFQFILLEIKTLLLHEYPKSIFKFDCSATIFTGEVSCTLSASLYCTVQTCRVLT